MTQFIVPLLQIYQHEEGDLHVNVKIEPNALSVSLDFEGIGGFVCKGSDEDALAKDIMLALRTLAANTQQIPDLVIEALSELYLNLEDILYPSEIEDETSSGLGSISMDELVAAMSQMDMPIYALTPEGKIQSLSEKVDVPPAPKHFFFS